MDGPLQEILKRIVRVSEIYGTCFVKIVQEDENLVWSIIPNDQVIIKYEKRDTE